MIRSSFRILVILAVLGAVFTIMNDDIVSSKERLTGSRMVLCFGKLRQQVDKYLLKAQAVPAGITSPCVKQLSAMNISNSGIIKMSNTEFSIDLSFEPRKVNNKIRWACRGRPSDFVPKRCRGK